MAIVVDGEQRFTCHQCGRCCRHAWNIPVLPEEATALRAAGAPRWFRETEDAPEGARGDPFERVRGMGTLLRLRKRPDGACGFLSPDGRCRIHEELGERRKPLACRAFPFGFHPTEMGTLAAASFSCPTIVRNQGSDVASQKKAIERLARDWQRAFPDVSRAPSLVAGRPLDAQTLGILRQTLRAILDRPDGDTSTNLGRLADWLDDLGRPRVARLSPEELLDYVTVTGRFAVESEKAHTSRPPTRVARLFFRGYLFASGAVQLRLAARREGHGRLRLWARQVRLLLHTHGLASAPSGMDRAAARRRPLPPADAAAWRMAHAYCRAIVTLVGTGRWPVVTEIGVAMATLRVAFVFAALHADEQGPSPDDFVRGMTEAADIHHANAGTLGTLLGFLGGGAESLHALAGRTR